MNPGSYILFNEIKNNIYEGEMQYIFENCGDKYFTDQHMRQINRWIMEDKPHLPALYHLFPMSDLLNRKCSASKKNDGVSARHEANHE
ncbi:hypothetical protein XI25_27005 [Paenibacillus sp. DMB20]|nr:hypothetical protein XI25_27005 [Paenibacillus sp. DMB20]